MTTVTEKIAEMLAFFNSIEDPQGKFKTHFRRVWRDSQFCERQYFRLYQVASFEKAFE